MRITSSKTIHLTEVEIKEAIAQWLGDNLPNTDLTYNLFMSRNSILDFSKNGGLSIIIDGEVEEYNSEKK